MLLLSTLVFAHGSRFGMTTISVAPDDAARWWGVAGGWGVATTADAGAGWRWVCEEALGTSAIYDVDAAPGGAALVSAEAGLLLFDAESCAVTAVPGLGDGYPAFLVPDGDGGWWASAYTSGRDGLWSCTVDGCVEGPVGGEGTYVKSVVVDGGTTWLTTVTAESLAAALVRVDAGEVSTVSSWPDGSVDPRLLHVEGDTILLWAQGRDEAHPPALLRSTDGGAHFEVALEVGVYTDPVPALLSAGLADTYYLGTDAGRTFLSVDGGASFAEVTETAPAVRCSASIGRARVFCADHYADGYDVGTWELGAPFRGAGCLDAAEPAACTDTCDPYLAPFQEAGLYGGGACHPTLVAPEPTGCGGGAAWILLAPFGARLAARRLQSRRGA